MSPLSAARKFGIDTRGTALNQAQNATRLVSRADARRNRIAYNASIRKGVGSTSMVNMPYPVGHKRVPTFVSERDKLLFVAWKKRLESGKLG